MTLYADIPGERLDAFLARSIEGMTRSAAQRLLEEGCVLRAGKPGKKNDKLNMGDQVEVTLPEPKEVDITPTEMALDIVYEDEDVLVINKPKGLVVHPAAGNWHGTVVNAVLGREPALDDEDFDEDDDDECVSVECPSCGEEVFVDETMDFDNINCPSCGAKFSCSCSSDCESCGGCEN